MRIISYHNIERLERAEYYYVVVVGLCYALTLLYSFPSFASASNYTARTIFNRSFTDSPRKLLARNSSDDPKMGTHHRLHLGGNRMELHRTVNINGSDGDRSLLRKGRDMGQLDKRKRNNSLASDSKALHKFDQLRLISRNSSEIGTGVFAYPTAHNTSNLQDNNNTTFHPTNSLNKNTTFPTILPYLQPDAQICGIPDTVTGIVRPLRFLMSSSQQYISVILNWLIYFRKICTDRSAVYFICLDKGTEDAMKKLGLWCSYSYHARNRGQLWTMRARVTKQLLYQGYDVLMTDSDALWLKNPFMELQKYEKSDIIGSRASFPEHVSKRLGATLCMGFIYIKCTTAVKKLYEDLLLTMQKVPFPDDQRDINDLLLRKGLSYPTKPTYLGSKQANTGVLLYAGTSVRVTLLPHEDFRRVCEGVSITDLRKAVIVHCLSEKTGTSKQGVFSRIGLWTLRDTWENISTSTKPSSFDKFLDIVTVAETVKETRPRRLFKVKTYPKPRHPVDITNTSVGDFVDRATAIGCSKTAVYCDPSFSRWNISHDSTSVMEFEEVVSRLDLQFTVQQ